MEEDNSSWVRRVKFSHTVCHRLDTSRLPSIPISVLCDPDQEQKPKSLEAELIKLSSMPCLTSLNLDKTMPKLRSLSLDYSSLHSVEFSTKSGNDSRSSPRTSSSDSSDFAFHLDRDPKVELKTSHSRPVFAASLNSKNRIVWGSKPTQRSVSPLPITKLSETFKEARADGKRFSTPPPSRKSSEKGTFGKIFSREAHDHRLFNVLLQTSPPHKFSAKASNELKNHGGGINSVDIASEWMVDLSKLYLGLRFASGANSRLYHGIYKDQPVAVKLIRQPDDDENGELGSRLEKQFNREVGLLSHLYHRNVIKLVAACKKPPVFCIITEYLSGGSLRAFLHKPEHRSLPLRKLLLIALDIARGMEYVHSQGVIHRDLKPENIIFDEYFCIRIADFGIACEEAYCDALGEDPGTYRWMAPEMIKHKHYGHKVDVYSFGLVLWELVTGKIPYEDMTPVQAAFSVVDKNLRPTIPPICPAPLRVLIEQCWTLHPEKRPEFWQIVKVLEQFESALAQDGTLDHVQGLTCHEQKNRLLQWIQKLKPIMHSDDSGAPMPKLL